MNSKITTLATYGLTLLGVFLIAYALYFKHPLHGYESAVYPMIVSAYTALIGFVVAASTILLTIMSQQSSARGKMLIVASANGEVKNLFATFIKLKNQLLLGVLLGIVGLVIDRPPCYCIVRFTYYGFLVGNCYLILNQLQYAISDLNTVGQSILDKAQTDDTSIVDLNAGRTADMEFLTCFETKQN